jgi:hypothetical protein
MTKVMIPDGFTGTAGAEVKWLLGSRQRATHFFRPGDDTTPSRVFFCF